MKLKIMVMKLLSLSAVMKKHIPMMKIQENTFSMIQVKFQHVPMSMWGTKFSNTTSMNLEKKQQWTIMKAVTNTLSI